MMGIGLLMGIGLPSRVQASRMISLNNSSFHCAILRAKA